MAQGQEMLLAEMSQIVASQSRLVSSSQALISFVTDSENGSRPWWRWLTIDGQKTYLLGNICDTCDFFFERQKGATKKPEVETLKDALVAGVHELTPAILATLENIVPSGSYEALLLKTPIHPVQLGAESDYFTHEQIENSGVNTFWGLPRHPKVPYYRGDTRQFHDRERFFEFVVPLFPKIQLNAQRVEFYRTRLSEGSCPTAVALSVLDVKTPSISPKGYDEETHSYRSDTHYCLAHYLLDGHHKVEAAAQAGTPISMISFLAVDQGVSSSEEIQKVLSLLGKG